MYRFFFAIIFSSLEDRLYNCEHIKQVEHFNNYGVPNHADGMTAAPLVKRDVPRTTGSSTDLKIEKGLATQTKPF